MVHPNATRQPRPGKIIDHSPFLQKMIGDGTPGEILKQEILKQLDEIDVAEAEFESKSGASAVA